MRTAAGRRRLGTRLLLFAAAVLGVCRPAYGQEARPASAPRQLPVYFEPRPDGSLIGRNLAHAIWVDGRRIQIASTGTGKPAPFAIEFAGARRDAKVEGTDPQHGRVNYLIGNDRSKWRTGVGTFARARTRDLYPGIDVEYYAADRQLEYDFIVRPGASPRVIRMHLPRGSRPEITAEGDLRLTSNPDAVQRRPIAYQTREGRRRIVRAAYVIRKDDTVGIRVHAYDPTLPLTIDPILVYGATIGASVSTETAYDIDVDDEGAVYVAGTVRGTTGPGSPTNPAGTCRFGEGIPDGPCLDGFVTKLTPAGTHAFTTYLAGSDNDWLFSVAADSQHRIYAIGWTHSGEFKSECLGSPLQFNHCYIVTKLRADGTPEYAVVPFQSGSRDVVRPPMVIDVAGDTSGTAFLLLNFSQPFKWAVASLSPSGDAAQILYEDDALETAPAAIALAPAGHVVVTGTTTSIDFPTTVGAAQQSLSGHIVYSVEGVDAAIVPVDADVRRWDQVVRIASSRVDPQLFFASGTELVIGAGGLTETTGTLARSRDGGRTWTSVSATFVPQEIVTDPRDSEVAYFFRFSGTDCLRKTVDGGITVQPIPLPGGGCPSQLLIDPATGTLYAGVPFQGTFKSINAGSSWAAVSRFGSKVLLAIDSATPARIYAREANTLSLLRTTDEGATWTTVTGDALVSLDPSDPETFYVSTNDGVLRKTTDDAATWQTALVSPVRSSSVFTGSVHPVFPGTVLVEAALDSSGRRGFWRSIDGGSTWTTPLMFLPAGVHPFAFDASDPLRFLVGDARHADAFVAGLDRTGTLLFSTLVGGRTDESVRGLSLDAAGAVHVAGTTNSTDFAATGGLTPADLNGFTRSFVARVAADGGLIEYATALTAGSSSPIVRAGSNDIVHAGACRISTDCALAELDVTGAIVRRAQAVLPLSLLAFGLEGSQYYATPSPTPPFNSTAGDVTIRKYTWLAVDGLNASAGFPARFGAPITWTAHGIPAGGIEYQFWRYDASSGWSEVQPYGPSASYTWTPAYADIGAHALQVWARPVGSTDRYEAWAGTEFSITAGPLPSVTALTPSRALPTPAGSPITWTATASGGAGSLLYQFWRLDADGWHMVQDYGAANTYTWTPATTHIGAHALQAWVKNADSPASYEGYLAATFDVREPDPVTVTSLTADGPFPSPAGRVLTWTAQAQGGVAPLQYRFWRLDATGWRIVQDYGSSNVYTWAAPGESDQGAHALQVWVRSTGSAANYDAWAGMTFDITPPAPVRVSALTANVAMPVRAGTAITWTATASGGFAPLQYQFWRLDADGWHMVQNYSSSNTYTWTPNAGQTGSHALQVWVRSVGSSANYEAWSGVTFTIDPPPPVVIQSFTANRSFPSPIGTPITWTATASGGAAPLEYQFWRLDSDGWHMAQAYGASSTYTWTPTAGAEGTHAVQVWIRSAGSTANYDNWAGTGYFTITP